MLAPEAGQSAKIKVETDEGVFEGEPLENGMRQGMGKATYENGNVYNGMWKNNKRRKSPANSRRASCMARAAASLPHSSDGRRALPCEAPCSEALFCLPCPLL